MVSRNFALLHQSQQSQQQFLPLGPGDFPGGVGSDAEIKRLYSVYILVIVVLAADILRVASRNKGSLEKKYSRIAE